MAALPEVGVLAPTVTNLSAHACKAAALLGVTIGAPTRDVLATWVCPQ